MYGGMIKEMGRPKKKSAGANASTPGFAIRGSKEWHAWVTALAEFRRLKVTDVIDQALVEFASKHGYEPPAPKR